MLIIGRFHLFYGYLQMLITFQPASHTSTPDQLFNPY